MALCAAYEALEDTKQSLCKDVEAKFGGDLEFAALARCRPRFDFLAYRLYKACKGWGTDEECICRVLGCLDNNEVKVVAERYNEMYADQEEPFNDFLALIGSELSGSLLDGIRRGCVWGWVGQLCSGGGR